MKNLSLILSSCLHIQAILNLTIVFGLMFNFFKRDLQSFPFYCFPLFLCIMHLKWFLISPCYSLELRIQMGITFLFSSVFHFSSFLSYLEGLLRQTFCLFVFLFLGDDLDHSLLYNITNFCPQFFRHSIKSSTLNLFVTSTV